MTLLKINVILLALGTILVACGLLICRPVSENAMAKAKFNVTLTVDGKAHVVSLVRDGSSLTGTLPKEVQGKYEIKTFQCERATVQRLVDKKISQFRDNDGRLWVEVGQKPGPMSDVGGSWYRYSFVNRPPQELVAIATVNSSGQITAGWPPVYS